LLLAALLSLGPGAAPAHAEPRDKDGISPNLHTNSPQVLAAFRPVVAQPSASTVRVRCGKSVVALGTVVGADGWILTKYSELKADPVCLLKDGRELPAELIGAYEPYDLAMLKVNARDLKPVQWGDIKSALVGNWVATPGNAGEPLAVGVVSVAARKTTARDLPPVHTNSGFLGIVLEEAENGVKIAQVMPNSAAAKAGLLANDSILAIADKPIPDPATLMLIVQRYKPGQVVMVKVKRGDEELVIKATLGKRPNDGRSDFQNHLGGDLSNRRGGFPSVLQHDTVLQPAECGGPLVDLDGKAIGINIARAGRTETYAVPANEVQPLLADLKSGKLLPEDPLTNARRKVEKARAALAQAEADRAAAHKRLQEARAAQEKDSSKVQADLEMAQADRAAADKRIKEAQAALVDAEIELEKIKKEK